MKYKLRDLHCRFLSGYAFKSTAYAATGIPLIKIGNIQNKIVEINPDGNYVSADLINPQTEKFLLQHKDVLIAMTGQGSVGRVGRLYLKDNEKAFLNQRVGKFICDEQHLHLDFLFYVLSGKPYQELLFSNGTGSGQPNLSPESILNTSIPWVEYTMQRRIAAILSSIDEKIELNRQLNQTLENTARIIYKDWFVTGTWKEGRLGDIISNFDSKRVPLSSMEREKRKGIYPYYGAASVVDYVDDYLFDGVYLLMGEDGTVMTADEKPVLQYVDGKFWVNNHAHVLRGKDHFSTEYVYLTLLHTNVKHLVTGAVQPKINQGNLNNLKISMPDDEIIKRFTKTIKPLFELILLNKEQIQTLSELRDTLLPKMISGEISVQEVEQQYLII